MQGILFWLAIGLAALFCVAVVVAWWEHLGRKAERDESLAAPAAQPMAVDLNLDNLPPDDAAARRGALEDALQRMTQPGSLGAEIRRRWHDTMPMIAAGLRAELREDVSADASSAAPASPRATESARPH